MANNDNYAGRRDLTSVGTVWRAARPGIILVVAVLVGSLAVTTTQRILIATASAALLVLLATVVAIGRRRLDEHPIRIVYVAELEVAALICGVVVALASVVNAVAWA